MFVDLKSFVIEVIWIHPIVLDLIMSIDRKDQSFGIKEITYLVTSYLYERKIFFQLFKP